MAMYLWEGFLKPGRAENESRSLKTGFENSIEKNLRATMAADRGTTPIVFHRDF
jgi:hypothetical protein